MVKARPDVFSGFPTIELLWSSRERIFPQAERGKPYVAPKKKVYKGGDISDADEYKEPSDKNVGHGW